MNAAKADGNGDGDGRPELEQLFTELARVKDQRDRLQAQLAECRRENRELRAQLGRDS